MPILPWSQEKSGNVPVTHHESMNPRRNLFNLMDEYFRDWDLFPRSLSTFGMLEGNIVPAVNFSETDKSYLIEAELPGVKKEDVKIDLDENQLTFKGEKKTFEEEKKGEFYRMERSYGTFTRSFQLPPDVDTKKIEAKMNDGVLRIELAKSQESGKKRQSINVH